MQLTLFDIIVDRRSCLSALAALMRGAVREILALVELARGRGRGLPGVAVVAPLVQTGGRRRGAWPLASAAAGVFLVALIALKMLSGMVASADRRQRPRPARQGAGAGVRRGARRVRRLRRLSRSAAYLIKPDLQPDLGARRLSDRPGPGGRAIGSRLCCRRPIGRARPDDPRRTRPLAKGYTDAERQALDKLVSPQP